MKREEAIEIADEIYMSPPWTNSAEERIVMLCNEVERRTLERAAVVCIGIANKPSNVVLGVAIECATAIRALKENT